PMTARPVTPICAELLIELAPHDLGNGAAGAAALPVGARQSCRDHPGVPLFLPHARVVTTRTPPHTDESPTTLSGHAGPSAMWAAGCTQSGPPRAAALRPRALRPRPRVLGSAPCVPRPRIVRPPSPHPAFRS